MISKLAKSIAHFFVIQKIVEEPREVIYAYGLELMLSDVVNTIVVLIIALLSHTLLAVTVFVAVFMGLRRFVGGYHANSHLSCISTLIVVMLLFSFGICNASKNIAFFLSVSFVAFGLPLIFCFSPVAHPNKPMSNEKRIQLRKTSIINAIGFSLISTILLIFHLYKFSLYVSSGILLSAVMAFFGHFLNRGDER